VGGRDHSGTLNDAWHLEGWPFTWVQDSGTLLPVRSDAAAVFDGLVDTVVAGTSSIDGKGGLEDTWDYGHYGYFINVPGYTPPPPRYGAGYAVIGGSRPFVFGGMTASGVSGDTWVFVDGVWSLLAPYTGPRTVDGNGLVAGQPTPRVFPSTSTTGWT